MAEITFELIWEQEPPDAKPCHACGDLICSVKWVLYLSHAKGNSKCDVELCDACYWAAIK